uniref:Uncharacterized protein n=1 Tax=Eptatretus burgeri TaxID=7764 RepID=A0A8C4WVI7_EPTBU
MEGDTNVVVHTWLQTPAAVPFGPFRGMFTATKNDSSKPNWLRVGLAFGTTVALWISVSHSVVDVKDSTVFFAKSR